MAALPLSDYDKLNDAATPLAFSRVNRGLAKAKFTTAICIPQSYVASLESSDGKGDLVLFLRHFQPLKVQLEYLIIASDETDAIKFDE